MPRLHSPEPLHGGQVLALAPAAARHVQVLRLQPGDAVTLFDGRGGEWDARIERIGRTEVQVRVGEHHAIEREAGAGVHLAVGMPANERMDWLVEKATELGAASLQPLETERTVLRLSGERAGRRQAHWQAVAVSACEQCGRNRVPPVHALQPLGRWAVPVDLPSRAVLSLASDAQPLHTLAGHDLLLLSGPEGGLSAGEEAWARRAGFVPVTLGPRVLRAETAPLAALAVLTLGQEPAP